MNTGADRTERLLALATAFSAIAILTSLFFGGWFSAWVSPAGAGIGFSAAFFLSLLALAGLVWKRTDAPIQWIAAAVLAVLLILVARLGMSPIERSHLFEFGCFAGLLTLTLERRTGRLGSPNHPVFISWLIAISVGVLDEFVQLYLPGRVFDPRDLLFNTLAASFVVVVLKLTRRTTRT